MQRGIKDGMFLVFISILDTVDLSNNLQIDQTKENSSGLQSILDGLTQTNSTISSPFIG